MVEFVHRKRFAHYQFAFSLLTYSFFITRFENPSVSTLTSIVAELGVAQPPLVFSNEQKVKFPLTDFNEFVSN